MNPKRFMAKGSPHSIIIIFLQIHPKRLISTPTTVDPSPSSKVFINSSIPATTTIRYPHLSIISPFQHFRSFCSSPGPSKIVLVKSEEDFTNSFSNAQDKSLPAVFYFTAAWCGPCRFISPVIEELSQKYPHVTTYKIDIDQESIQGTLGKLHITAVPTLHFFQNGKKAAEIVGADVARLKDTMEKLYQ
ncbi:Thioredoxin [Quillaja saponaria]|uniref:Thioredoxin n=1 Tax=Quillaja saponaria TaxID=32244 RepID=A0AAD7QCQ7_QUISA|nr:Thioredoxin [Quillaja saponaria]